MKEAPYSLRIDSVAISANTHHFPLITTT